MKNNNGKLQLAALALITCPLATYAVQLEEVIVTAQKRQENMQTVPVAVSALTADQLQDIGFNDIGDIAAQVPSLVVLTNISPMATTFRVRNIGNAGNIPNFEPATGLFIDGAFRSRSGIGIGDIVDVSSIEVLKGPQSTLHGKNVTAGVISVNTQGPTEQFEAMAEATVGGDRLRQFKSYVSGPLNSWLNGRVSFVDTKRDEIIDNVAGPDGDSQDGYAIRGQLQADFSDALTARLIVGYSEKDMNPMTGDLFLSDATRSVITRAGGSLSIPNDPSDRLVENDDSIIYTSESLDVIFKLEYSGDGYTLTSISSFDDYDSLTEMRDVEQMSLHASVFNDRQFGESFSQELRAASDSDGPFNWLVGGFYYTNTFIRGDRNLPEFLAEEDIEEYGNAVAVELASRGALPGGILLPAQAPILGVEGDRGDYYITQDTESVGFFSKLDFSFSEQWKAALGLRYSFEEKTGVVTQTTELSELGCVPPLNTNLMCQVTPDGNDFDQTDSFEAVTGSISTSYFLSGDTMLYGTVSTGFKAGGFSLQYGTATDEMRPFGEEEVTNYELGLKTEFLDRRARVNMAMFHTEYQGFQNASFAGLVFIINNADLVTVDGIEIDSTMIVTENLSATFNFAFIDTVFDRYTGGQCYYGKTPDNDFGQCDLSGQHLPASAEIKSNIALNWRYPFAGGDIYTRFDYTYSGEANSSSALDPLFDQPANHLANLRVGWRDDSLDLAVWGKNITDEMHVSQIAPANIHTVIDTRLNSPVGSYQTFSTPPVTVGVTARYLF
ncbi:MAG: iron complex outermembrane receptor protein [Zhongshania sp.]|jgi:iron complex outermembrane receptor protein